MSVVIRADGLSKTFKVRDKQPGLKGSVKALFQPAYKEVAAVAGVSLEVERGDAVAFLGPNGGGKSTTIKMLTGILHPTKGTAEVLDLVPWKGRRQLSYQIGAVFGQRSQLWPHLPAMDCFRLLGRIYDLPAGEFSARLKYLMDLFEIGSFVHTPTRKLSLGQRMRCEIVASMLHRPEVLFLDEPSIGLDLVAKTKIRDLLRRLNREEGVTLFLTSHDVRDIEVVCRRAVVINRGKLVCDTTVSDLRERYMGVREVRLRLATPLSASPLQGARVSGDGYNLTIPLERGDDRPYDQIGRLLQQHSVLDMTVSETPLEQVITAIYGEGA